MTEEEPNDMFQDATDLGGSGSHEVSGKACSDDDIFLVTTENAGTVTLELEWTDGDGDLGVELTDIDGGFPLDADDDPPGALQGALGADAVAYIVIFCDAPGSEPIPYSGTVTVP